MVICLFFIDIKNIYKTVAMNQHKSKLATQTNNEAQTMQTDDMIIIILEVLTLATWALFKTTGVF